MESRIDSMTRTTTPILNSNTMDEDKTTGANHKMTNAHHSRLVSHCMVDYPILLVIIAKKSDILVGLIVDGTQSISLCQVCKLLLCQRDPQKESQNKVSYKYDDYRFHYITSDNLVYLVVTKKDFSRRKSFRFLDDIKNRFIATYGYITGKYNKHAFREFHYIVKAQMKNIKSTNVRNIVRGDSSKYEEREELKCITDVEDIYNDLRDIVPAIKDHNSIYSEQSRETLPSADYLTLDHMLDTVDVSSPYHVDTSTVLPDNSSARWKQRGEFLKHRNWQRFGRVCCCLYLFITFFIFVIVYVYLGSSTCGFDFKKCLSIFDKDRDG